MFEYVKTVFPAAAVLGRWQHLFAADVLRQ